MIPVGVQSACSHHTYLSAMVQHTLLGIVISCCLIQCHSALLAPTVLSRLDQRAGDAQSAATTCKGRGLGFGFNSTAQLHALRRISWWYDWGTGKRTELLNRSASWGIEYVPMQWGEWGIEQLQPGKLAPHSQHLLGFNEPNYLGQAGLTPERAARLWPYLEAVAREAGLLLGAPAAAPCGARCVEPDPFRWWDQFFALCQGCRFDFLATHYYTCSPTALASYLQTCRKYGLPIWVTELACPNRGGHPDRALAYMVAALDVLDSDPWVEAYAWFSADTSDFEWLGPSNSLLNLHTNQLTPLGELYLRHAPSSCTPALRRPGQGHPGESSSGSGSGSSSSSGSGGVSGIGSNSISSSSRSRAGEHLSPGNEESKWGLGAASGGSWMSQCGVCIAAARVEGLGGMPHAQREHCSLYCGFWDRGSGLPSHEEA